MAWAHFLMISPTWLDLQHCKATPTQVLGITLANQPAHSSVQHTKIKSAVIARMHATETNTKSLIVVVSQALSIQFIIAFWWMPQVQYPSVLRQEH